MNVLLILTTMAVGEQLLPSGDYALKPSTAYSTCQCGGSNTKTCYCLQNGIACHCNAAKGSVWNLDDKGKAVSKTGTYTTPNKTQAVQTSAMVRPTTQTVAQQPVYRIECQNGYCKRVRIR